MYYKETIDSKKMSKLIQINYFLNQLITNNHNYQNITLKSVKVQF